MARHEAPMFRCDLAVATTLAERLTSLDYIDTTHYGEGTLAWCDDTQRVYVLQKASGGTANGTTIVVPQVAVTADRWVDYGLIQATTGAGIAPVEAVLQGDDTVTIAGSPRDIFTSEAGSTPLQIVNPSDQAVSILVTIHLSVTSSVAVNFTANLRDLDTPATLTPTIAWQTGGAENGDLSCTYLYSLAAGTTRNFDIRCTTDADNVTVNQTDTTIIARAA